MAAILTSDRPRVVKIATIRNLILFNEASMPIKKVAKPTPMEHGRHSRAPKQKSRKTTKHEAV